MTGHNNNQMDSNILEILISFHKVGACVLVVSFVGFYGISTLVGY